MLMTKRVFSISVFIFTMLLAIPCFASSHMVADKSLDSKTITTSFNEISITGQGPIGVELVKTDKDTITIEYLNVEHKERYTATQSVKDKKLQITITNSAPQYGINVLFGPEEYKNVIRVYIPDAEYAKFEVNAYEMVVHMQDFNAPVQATGERGGIYLKDETISQGTYNINVKSGPALIEASFISVNIDVNVEDGPVTLRFSEQPNNLYLDTTNCGPVVKRPNPWAAIYKIGNETPVITLTNTRGLTTVEVE